MRARTIILSAVAVFLSFFIAVMVVFCGVKQTSEYQHCVQNHTANKEQNQTKEYSAVSLTCEAKFIDAHNGLVTAGATIVVGVFTLALVFATALLWIAGEKQIELSRGIARRQLRAYLHVGRPKLSHVAIGQNPEIRFILKNTGATPARNVRTWCKATLVDWPHKGGYEFETTNETEGSVSVIAPSAFTKIGDDAKSLSHTDWNELVKKTKRILVNGRVTYTDIFGEDCWTTFRVWSWGVSGTDGGKADWRWAEAGNDCDQN